MNSDQVPLISVLVPVYNVEAFLPTCIESIAKQTFKNFEVVLVNDGSTDKSGELCDEISHSDTRFRVIHKVNEGVAFARNTCLKEANGAWVTFVDSDDWISETYLESLLQIAERHPNSIPWANVVKVSESGSECVGGSIDLEIPRVFSQHEALVELTQQTYAESLLSTSWGKLIPSSLFSGISYQKDRILDDEFVAHRWISLTQSITRCDDAIYYYRQRQGSIVSSPHLHSKRVLDSLESLVDRMEFYESSNLKQYVPDTSRTGLERAFSLLHHPLTRSNQTPRVDKQGIYRTLIANTAKFRRVSKQPYKASDNKSFKLFVRFPKLYIKWCLLRKQ